MPWQNRFKKSHQFALQKKPNTKISCIQLNFPSNFRPYDAFYKKFEENTFVPFIMKYPLYQISSATFTEDFADKNEKMKQ